jgi:hypothetical protein
VSQLAPGQVEALTAAITAQDCLRRVRDEIEELHRVVFHAKERIAWDLVRRSAEQILMAEIVYRHQGHPDGIFLALRALEDHGSTWDEAIRELAAGIHSYYTTPLGFVLRADLFGRDATFIMSDAEDWKARLSERAGASRHESS